MVWVNLLPWRRQRQRRQLRRDILLALAMLAVLVATTVPLLEQQALGERRQLEIRWLQESNGRLDKLKSRLVRLEQQRETLQRELAASERLRKHSRAWHALMRDLAGTMPAALWLSEITRTAAILTLKGVSQQLAEVEAFRQQLQKMPLLQQVITDKLSRDEQGLIHFSLHGALALPEQAHE